MNDIIFNIRKDVLSYSDFYFIDDTKKQALFDNEIASFLKLNTQEFEALMRDKFNGKLIVCGRISFWNEEDAKKAVEYINSIILIEKLSGN